MRVLLIDGQRCFQESFAVALAATCGQQIAGTATSAHEALAVLNRVHPTIVVSELTLPDSDCISMALELRRRRVEVPILILTSSHDPHLAYECLRVGIRGYSLKSQSLRAVVSAVTQVAAGKIYVAPQLAPRPAPAQTLLSLLSRREREIVLLIVQGLATRDIARSLFVSVKTVETHRLHIHRKLGTNSVVSLLRLAADSGLLHN